MTGSLNEILLRFAVFLSRNWAPVQEAAMQLNTVEADELLSDWAQANWEILVETAFKDILGERDVFLEPYGEGADCNDSSSRVWMPGATPTHRVVCHPREAANVRDELTGDTIELATGRVVFDQFATRGDNGWRQGRSAVRLCLGISGRTRSIDPCGSDFFRRRAHWELSPFVASATRQSPPGDTVLP